MNRQHGLPLLVGHFLNDVVPGVPGIVDNDVQAAELVNGGGHKAIGKSSLGDIAHTGHGLAAGGHDVFHRLRCRRGIQVVDDHTGPLAGQFQGNLAANATA